MSDIKDRILKLSEFDDYRSRYKMPRRYEHIDRPDLWSMAQSKENARLKPLIEQLAELLELLHEKVKYQSADWVESEIEETLAKLEGRGE